MHKKLYIYASIAIAVIIVIATVLVLFPNTVKRVVNPVVTRLDESQASLPLQFTDQTNSGYDFILTTNFPYHEEYFKFLEGSPLYKQNITINITEDQSNARAKNMQGQVVISGFTFTSVDNITEVRLYISPDLSTDKRLYEINNTLLTALLHASEELKLSQSNNEYFPEIKSGNVLTHKIMTESYDTNNYALKKK